MTTPSGSIRLYITALFSVCYLILGVLTSTQLPDVTTSASSGGVTQGSDTGGSDNSDTSGGIDKSQSEPDDVVYDAEGAIYIGIAFFSLIGAFVLFMCLCDIPTLFRHVKYATKNVNHGKKLLKEKTQGKPTKTAVGKADVNADSMERLVTSGKTSPRSSQVAPM